MHKTQIPLEDLNEEIVIDSLPVQGKIPHWLEGTLIRNGPAKFHLENKTISHWFDGLAMLHAFSFGSGKVSYRNRFIRSDAYMKENGHFMGFAEDPCVSVFKRLFAYFLPGLTPTLIQNANVNVMRIAKETVALTETPLPVRFDPKTLETLGVLDYQDNLAKKDCFESAHPHYDRVRKETVSFQIEMGRECRYRFYSVGEEASRKPFFEMTREKASYMHSFAMTKRYVILVEYPLLLNPLDLLLKSGGYITHFKWYPQESTKFFVIDRLQGKLVKTYETEALFCFHHVNAYEEQGGITLDLVSYPNADIVYGDPGNQARKLERFRLGDTLTRTTIAESLLELPRIYYQKFNTNPYKYVYGVGFQYSDPIPLIKIDVTNGSKREWMEEGALAGEPVFVPKPDAKDEDDGVLLSLVTSTKSSFLLILDAKNLQEIARSEVLHRIPYGLHGMFWRNT